MRYEAIKQSGMSLPKMESMIGKAVNFKISEMSLLWNESHIKSVSASEWECTCLSSWKRLRAYMSALMYEINK